jgi:hypothetical protein
MRTALPAPEFIELPRSTRALPGFPAASSEATFGLDLLEGWHSVAKLHHNGYLIRMFSVASEELRDLKAEAVRRIAQIDRADHEFESSEEICLDISEGE